MTSSTKPRVFAVIFLLAFVGFVSAQAPSGLIDFSFDSASTRVFDLSGSVTIEQQMIGAGDTETPVSFSVDISQDSSGKLSGSGVTLLNVGNDFIAATYTVKGKFTGGGTSINRASFTIKLSGQDTVAGVPNTKFSLSLEYKLEANSEEQLLFGSVRGSAKFSGFSSGKFNSGISIALPSGMDGSWSTEMNILALKKLGGSATITLSNQRVLSTSLSGSYSSSSAVSKVKLTGSGASKSTSVKLDFISSQEGTEVEKLSGKILGQSVRQ